MLLLVKQLSLPNMECTAKSFVCRRNRFRNVQQTKRVETKMQRQMSSRHVDSISSSSRWTLNCHSLLRPNNGEHVKMWQRTNARPNSTNTRCVQTKMSNTWVYAHVSHYRGEQKLPQRQHTMKAEMCDSQTQKRQNNKTKRVRFFCANKTRELSRRKKRDVTRMYRNGNVA